MKQPLIGRETESKILSECYKSSKSELVAIYGRRRVGKTFLVRSLFEDRFDFFLTGIFEGTLLEELTQFNKKLIEYSKIPYPVPKNWGEAFDQLKHYIAGLGDKRVMVFIDEMPWLDTPRSRFVKAFDNFWNEWASARGNIFVIICGSATTWMNDNVISQKGGLHARTTRRIKLSQFNLYETEKFLESKGVRWPRLQIAECWMILGGTPYYLDLLRAGMSLSQNVDFLFFRKDAELVNEYSILLKSLFKESAIYRRVIELLAKRSRGMSRSEILSSLGLGEGGSVTKVLENLRECDFIRDYSAFGKKERDTMYQLTDMFTLFCLKFIVGKGAGRDEEFWSHSIDSPFRRAWSDYAFEQLCFNHIPQIKESLGIRGILSNVCSWSRKADPETGEPGGQIDMLIDRRDRAINVCEMKFSMSPFVVTRKYLEEMSSRADTFRRSTRTGSALILTMITSCGLFANEYSSAIPVQLTLDDLF